MNEQQHALVQQFGSIQQGVDLSIGLFATNVLPIPAWHAIEKDVVMRCPMPVCMGALAPPIVTGMRKTTNKGESMAAMAK